MQIWQRLLHRSLCQIMFSMACILATNIFEIWKLSHEHNGVFEWPLLWKEFILFSMPRLIVKAVLMVIIVRCIKLKRVLCAIDQRADIEPFCTNPWICRCTLWLYNNDLLFQLWKDMSGKKGRRNWLKNAWLCHFFYDYCEMCWDTTDWSENVWLNCVNYCNGTSNVIVCTTRRHHLEGNVWNLHRLHKVQDEFMLEFNDDQGPKIELILQYYTLIFILGFWKNPHIIKYISTHMIIITPTFYKKINILFLLTLFAD